jgi:ferredoxin
MGGNMKVYIDKETCIGCGLCASTCPDIFEMQDNLAFTLMETVPAEQEECTRQMEKDCPVDAIKTAQ